MSEDKGNQEYRKAQMMLEGLNEKIVTKDEKNDDPITEGGGTENKLILHKRADSKTNLVDEPEMMNIENEFQIHLVNYKSMTTDN